MPFTVEKTSLPGVVLVKPKVFGDEHGFYTLSAMAEVFYKVTAEYSQEHERGIIGNELHISIDWPEGEKILSEKGKKNAFLKEGDLFE